MYIYRPSLILCVACGYVDSVYDLRTPGAAAGTDRVARTAGGSRRAVGRQHRLPGARSRPAVRGRSPRVADGMAERAIRQRGGIVGAAFDPRGVPRSRRGGAPGSGATGLPAGSDRRGDRRGAVDRGPSGNGGRRTLGGRSGIAESGGRGSVALAGATAATRLSPVASGGRMRRGGRRAAAAGPRARAGDVGRRADMCAAAANRHETRVTRHDLFVS